MIDNRKTKLKIKAEICKKFTTISRFCDVSGISYDALVRNLNENYYYYPNLDLIVDVADILHVSLDDLIVRKDAKK